MKADIDEKGVLSITPETSLETYALSCWYNAYVKEDENRTILMINLVSLKGEQNAEKQTIIR